MGRPPRLTANFRTFAYFDEVVARRIRRRATSGISPIEGTIAGDWGLLFAVPVRYPCGQLPQQPLVRVDLDFNASNCFFSFRIQRIPCFGCPWADWAEWAGKGASCQLSVSAVIDLPQPVADVSCGTHLVGRAAAWHAAVRATAEPLQRPRLYWMRGRVSSM